MHHDQNSTGLFNGSTNDALGILMHLSETTGRIEARQSGIAADVKQTKAEVRRIDKRLTSVENRRINLADIQPYLYGFMVLTLAAAGKLDWSKAAELLK
jgi:hypothetical protein